MGGKKKKKIKRKCCGKFRKKGKYCGKCPLRNCNRCKTIIKGKKKKKK